MFNAAWRGEWHRPAGMLRLLTCASLATLDDMLVPAGLESLPAGGAPLLQARRAPVTRR